MEAPFHPTPCFLLPAWNFRLRGRAFFCNYYHYFQYADPGYCRKCRHSCLRRYCQSFPGGHVYFQRLAQGAQPLISQNYGQGKQENVRKLLKWSILSCLVLELVTVALSWGFTDGLIGIFNSENNLLLLNYAHTGLRIYFLGFLFAGINIMLVAYFSATDNARPSHHRFPHARNLRHRRQCRNPIETPWNKRRMGLLFKLGSHHIRRTAPAFQISEEAPKRDQIKNMHKNA